jgi:hypothetical protein
MKKAIVPADYTEFLTGLKERIRSAQITAARAVNRELILLYWDIGRAIVEKQRTAHWGESVVERLSADLRAEFPGMRGFSADNVWRMRQLYEEQRSKGSRVPDFVPPHLEQLVQTMRSTVLNKLSHTGSSGLVHAEVQTAIDTVEKVHQHLFPKP